MLHYDLQHTAQLEIVWQCMPQGTGQLMPDTIWVLLSQMQKETQHVVPDSDAIVLCSAMMFMVDPRPPG